MAKQKTEFALVVTTAHRGVFFGYVDDKPTAKTTELYLKRARMCVFWDSSCKGVLGLASNGPTKDCRISPPVKEFLVNAITSIAIVDDTVAKAWEASPWK